MRLEHVMSREAVRIKPTDTVAGAACAMRDTGVSSVLVCDDRGALVGILTQRDLSNKIIAEGLSSETLVSECMTANPVTADPRDRVWEGARLMAEHRIHHLPVISDGLPVGLVSSEDLSGMEAEPRATRDVIRGISESSREQTVEIPVSVASSDLGDIIPAWY